jgi:hypothetical protein
VPAINRLIAAWRGRDTIPHWSENAGQTAERVSVPGLFIQSGRHDPEIVFGRHDYAYDKEQQSKLSLIGVPVGDLLSRLDTNETQIEKAGVKLLTYIAPGTDHTALSDGTFYTEQVNGQRLVDWVTRLIERQPLNDVHCRKCRVG